MSRQCRECGGISPDADFADLAKWRRERAAKLRESYLSKGLAKQAGPLGDYLLAMDRIIDAAGEAEEAWTRYLRTFRAPTKEPTHG